MREVMAGQLGEELEVFRFEAGDHVPPWILMGNPRPGSRLDAMTFTGPALAVRYDGLWRIIPLEPGNGLRVEGEGHIVLRPGELPALVYGVKVRVTEGCA